jgi:hypothetical protein
MLSCSIFIERMRSSQCHPMAEKVRPTACASNPFFLLRKTSYDRALRSVTRFVGVSFSRNSDCRQVIANIY